MAVSMGAASLATSAVGAVTGAVGSYYNAKNQKSALQAQADTARLNAQLAGINADNALATAQTNSDTTLVLANINANASTTIAQLNSNLVLASNSLDQTIADSNYKIAIGQGDVEAATDVVNANLAEKAAQDSLRTGQRQEQQSRLQYAALKSTQRATMAANGVVLDEGSALRVQTDTDFLSDVDASTLHANAVRTAMGYWVQEANDLTAADTAKLNAQVQGFSIKAQALGANIDAQIKASNITTSAAFDALNTRTTAGINSMNILAQGRTDAFNDQLAALGYNNTARSQSAAASGISALTSGATSLIGGASSFANTYSNLSKAGVTSAIGDQFKSLFA